MEKLRHSLSFLHTCSSVFVQMCVCVCNFMHQTISNYCNGSSYLYNPPFSLSLDECGNMQNNYFDCILLLCNRKKERRKTPPDDDDDKVQLKECPLIFLFLSLSAFSLDVFFPISQTKNVSQHDLSLVLVVIALAGCNCHNGGSNNFEK